MPAAVLIAGLSTRTAAESAARAGFAVTAIDAFGDLDHHPAVRVVSLPRDFGLPFSVEAAAQAASGLDTDAVVYLANFENHPDAVSQLTQGRALWGNPPDVLRQVRDPLRLANALRKQGIQTPSIRTNVGGPNDPNDPNAWLVKPLASGGGRGVRPWDGTRVPDGCCLQQRIEGVPGSVVFVSAGGVAVPLGVSRQLIGEAAFGADGYRYCGNILSPADDPVFEQDAMVMHHSCAVASAVTSAFGLTGVSGVDFVTARGDLFPIEVNPRWTGSMELVERAYDLSVFGAHAAACEDGVLPDFDLRRARQGVRAVGKAILFARAHVTMGDTRQWLGNGDVRDVPPPGERIARGRPICTILADANDGASCYDALIRRAQRFYAAIEMNAPLD